MGLSRKSIFLNLFWSSTSFFTGIARTLFLVPIFLANWNEQLYGFWLLIANFYAISIYVIDGFSRYMINEYSKMFFSDRVKAYKYFGGGLRLLCIVIGIALLLLFVILRFSWPAQAMFHVNETVIDAYQLRTCLMTMFLLVGIHSIAKFISYGVLPHGKVYVPERFIALYSVAETLIWVLAAVGSMQLVYIYLIYSTVLALISVVTVIGISWNRPFYKVIYFRGDLLIGLRNIIRSVSLIVNNFCEKFTVEGLSFLVSAMFTAAMVPVYTTMRAMANFMVTGANMIVATFTIEYQKMYVAANGRSLLDLFNATWLLIGFLINYGLIIFYPFLPDIFHFWTKGQLEFHQQFFDLILAATVFIVFGSNVVIYLKSINRVKKVIIVSLTRAILVMSLIMIFPKELVFLGLGLFISEGIVNILLLNGMLWRELKVMDVEKTLTKVVWNALPFLVTVLYILFNRSIPVDIYLKMILTLCLVTTIYFVQIRKVDNDALLIRLQIIKFRLFGKRGK